MTCQEISMNANTHQAVALLAAALLTTACASGGGGASETTPPREPAAVWTSSTPSCNCAGFACLIVGCPQSEEEQRQERLKELGLVPSSTPAFTSWAELPPIVTPYFPSYRYQYDILGGSVGYAQDAQHAIVAVGEGSVGAAYRGSGPWYDAERKLHSTYSIAKWDGASFADLSVAGQPGIDLVSQGWTSTARNRAPSPFLESPTRNFELVANPYAIGWNYQSFGVWDDHERTSTIVPKSYGAASPASAVPTGGTARFTGKLAGLYVSPSGQGSVAAANLTVDADFRARSLTLASSGTVLTRNLTSAAPAPQLDLRGTLAYAPGGSTFTGPLASAGGTMSGRTAGQFYGPTAQELGGVFSLKAPSGVETFTGAYGAKR
jgi:hypothetical protein